MLGMDNSDQRLYSECLSVLSVIPFMIQNQRLISENIIKEIISKFILSISKKSSNNISDTLYILSLNMLLH